MKQLIKKEFALTGSKITYFFILFALMAFIPGYPILVSAFFVCLGLLYTFQFAREYNDILYTVMLPVSKKDAVKAKYLFCVCIQTISFIIISVIVAIRMNPLRNVVAYANNVLMNANLTFLAFVLIVFAVFNTIFLGGFFKTAYYYGKPFIMFSIVAFIIVGISETLHHLPGLAFLHSNTGNDVLIQAVILAVAVIFYVICTLASMNSSIKNFEKIDL